MEGRKWRHSLCDGDCMGEEGRHKARRRQYVVVDIIDSLNNLGVYIPMPELGILVIAMATYPMDIA